MRHLVLVLTSRCNLACSYCYEAGRSLQPDLGEDVARAAIDLLAGSTASPALLALTGGEPLVVAALFRRCVEHARARFPSPAALRIVASTNGTLLDEELVLFLARHDVALQVSCDGAGQELRATGTGEALDGALRLLAACEPSWFRRQVRVAITLTPANLPLLAESVSRLLARGVPEIAVDAVTAAEWPPGPELEAELDRQLARIDAEWRALAPWARHPPLALLRDPPPRRLPGETSAWCRAAAPESIAVDPAGVAWGCPLALPSMQRLTPAGSAIAGALRLGDVRDPGLASRAAALPARAAAVRALTHRRGKRSKLADCGACPHLLTCSPCPLASARVPGGEDPDFVPAITCALARASARVRGRAAPAPGLWPIGSGLRWTPGPRRDTLGDSGGSP